jgi:drug/metabolite transporter (DMT)-like permease
MWGLYTRALSLSPSTIQVNIINTAANFVITALLGMAVFGEKLPTQWWIGAGLLVSGSVIIGRREEQEVKVEEIRKKKQ